MAGHGIHPYHPHPHPQPQLQQPWAPPAPPPPPVPVPIQTPNRPIPADEVRTIFISGLPEDVKERELQNLLRWLPGYEASQLNFKGGQPMGFALFSNPHQAIAAKDALQNLEFDSENKTVLHTEMAKKNLYIKRGGVITEYLSFDPSKRMRTGGDYTHAVYPSPYPPPPPPSGPAWGAPGYIAPPPPYDPYGGYPLPQLAFPTPAPLAAPTGYVPVQNSKDNPPCNTLFIGNLGDDINEAELQSLFVMQPGYKQMKVLRQERNTVCFIEFTDVSSATAVHQNLQGAVIPSSGRGGMRIQYPF
ncbi:cell wall integrity protein scw1 isoform X2 [Iris pallida]|uniref:Cell wall integrity protein scw1 isoform X2 n=1 Tax=Iris pallida TaxID=29817 RepID=A0AAX6EYY3_IRIPA|nr:cell wall integrity protein scw1 isoform X2 [Iris pallida]